MARTLSGTDEKLLKRWNAAMYGTEKNFLLQLNGRTALNNCAQLKRY
jgi:hypothetical protein